MGCSVDVRVYRQLTVIFKKCFVIILYKALQSDCLPKVHDYREGTPEEKTYYIELWDVGGSVGSASSVKSTRAVFYNSVNGKV